MVNSPKSAKKQKVQKQAKLIYDIEVRILVITKDERSTVIGKQWEGLPWWLKW